MNETSAARRLLAAASAALLSVITGIVSYEHGLEVVRATGTSGRVAYLVPFVPDLMIVTSSLTLMEAAAVRTRRPLVAVAALVAGIGSTVAMNVAAGWQEGPGGALIAGAIPVAFVLTFEAFLWLSRLGRRPAAAGQGEAGCDHLPPLSLDAAIAAAYGHLPKRQIAAAFETSRARVAKVLPAEPRLAPERPAGTAVPLPPGDRVPAGPVFVPASGDHPNGDGRHV